MENNTHPVAKLILKAKSTKNQQKKIQSIMSYDFLTSSFRTNWPSKTLLSSMLITSDVILMLPYMLLFLTKACCSIEINLSTIVASLLAKILVIILKLKLTKVIGWYSSMLEDYGVLGIRTTKYGLKFCGSQDSRKK